MAEYKDVKLRIELDVTGEPAQATPGSAASATPPALPGPAAPAIPPRVVPAVIAPGRAGLPGSVGTPGAPGPAGAPAAVGRGWAPIPGPAGAAGAAGTPGPSVPPPIPGTPGGLSPAATLAAERQVANTVRMEIAAAISGGSPSGGAVRALIQAGAGASSVGGVMPAAGVAAAAAIGTVLAVERFGPALSVAIAKSPVLSTALEAGLFGAAPEVLRGASALGMKIPGPADFEEFSRGAAHLRAQLSSALEIGGDLQDIVTDQAVLFGKVDVPLAARIAHARYRIKTEQGAAERNKEITERMRFAEAASTTDFFMISLLGGLSNAIGR